MKNRLKYVKIELRRTILIVFFGGFCKNDEYFHHLHDFISENWASQHESADYFHHFAHEEVIIVSFLDKIDEYCQQHNMKQTPFERQAGLPKGIITRWKHGTKPRLDSLQTVADYMKIPLRDLMSTDAADICGSRSVPDNWSDAPDVVRDSALRYIPVYRSPDSVAQDPDPADIVTHLAVLPDNTPDADKCCGVTITDSGMSPYIEPGDVVIIRADDEPASEDIVVVYTPELGTMCRKLVRKGNDIILQPFNMHWNAIVYRQEELDLLPVIFKGKVIAIVRNVKSSSDSVHEL